MSCTYIFDLSTGVWQEIGEPSNLAVSSISGRLTSNYYIGKLNILIDFCFSGASGCIEPTLDLDQQAIYAQMYLYDYYGTRAAQSQGAIGVTNWVRIEEADSKISRSDPVNVSKFYLQLQEQARIKLGEYVDLYKRNLAVPRSVNFYSIEQNGTNGSCSDYRTFN